MSSSIMTFMPLRRPFELPESLATTMHSHVKFFYHFHYQAEAEAEAQGLLVHC